jgi:hypothetical protein
MAAGHSCGLFPLCLFALASPVRAQQRAPIVSLALEGEWPEALAADLRADLRASLSERNIDLIDASREPEHAVALLRIDAPAQGRAVVMVDDLVNDKRVERIVELGGDAPSVWSVLLAASADELLRAAWVEILLHDAPEPARDVPPAVRRAVETTLEVPRVPIAELGLAAAIDGYSRGAVLLGGDGWAAFFPDPRLGLEVAIVARGMVPFESLLGVVNAFVFGGELAVRGVLVRESEFSLEVDAGARALLCAWSGIPSEGVQARDALAPVIGVRGGVRAAFAIAPGWWARLRASAGVPLLGSIAGSDEGELVGIAGLELGLRLELAGGL